MASKKKIEIIFEDESIVVINKPAKLLSIPDRFEPDLPNLQGILQEKYGAIWVVHRLDRETSGLICFAKTEAAHKHLSQQFENRSAQKFYHALVDGNISGEKGIIQKSIASGNKGKMVISKSGKAATSLYQVEQRFKNFNWLQVEIKTGRTHQIRIHLQSIGHPLAVDALYGQRKALFLSEIKLKKYRLNKDQQERPLLSRIPLHASTLNILHPENDTPIEFTTPLPKDLKATLNQLTKWAS